MYDPIGLWAWHFNWADFAWLEKRHLIEMLANQCAITIDTSDIFV